MLLLLLSTPYLKLQNRRFGRAQIFKSQIPFIYAGFQTTVDDRRTTDYSGLNPTLSAIQSFNVVSLTTFAARNVVSVPKLGRFAVDRTKPEIRREPQHGGIERHFLCSSIEELSLATQSYPRVFVMSIAVRA